MPRLKREERKRAIIDYVFFTLAIFFTPFFSFYAIRSNEVKSIVTGFGFILNRYMQQRQQQQQQKYDLHEETTEF